MRRSFGKVFMALACVFGMIAITSTTAGAQWRVRNGGYDNQQVQEGYQDGVNTGASDAQRGQGYNPQRSRFYRDAPSQAFRNSFVNGYDAGYRQYAEANGGYRNNGSYGNGGYGNNGRYGGNNGRYGNGGYNNQQINAGYQQGINTGASDGQSNKSYSPQRSRYYQNARTQAYRDGFIRGYDEGFRQYSRNNNRYRRSNTGTSILDQIFRRP